MAQPLFHSFYKPQNGSPSNLLSLPVRPSVAYQLLSYKETARFFNRIKYERHGGTYMFNEKDIAYHGYGHLSLFLLLEQVCICFYITKTRREFPLPGKVCQLNKLWEIVNQLEPSDHKLNKITVMTQTEYVNSDHLRELHTSDFEIATLVNPISGHWKVIGLQNKELGRVEELLFHDISHEVRYLIVNLDGKPLNLVSRLILIPCGLVDLLRDEKLVLVNGLNIGHLASLPTYEKGKISRQTELEIRDVFSPGYVSSDKENNIIDDREIYDRKQFNDRAHPRTGGY